MVSWDLRKIIALALFVFMIELPLKVADRRAVSFIFAFIGINASLVGKPILQIAGRTHRTLVFPTLPLEQSENIESGIVYLEQRLRPIAERPNDITKPGWG